MHQLFHRSRKFLEITITGKIPTSKKRIVLETHWRTLVLVVRFIRTHQPVFKIIS